MTAIARDTAAQWHGIVTQAAVIGAARAGGLRTLVETGTLVGEMVQAALDSGQFDRIITIELAPGLVAAAKAKFAGCPTVEVIEGDSGKVLPDVLAGLTGPALLWLDAHYSAGPTIRGDADTPILAELAAVRGCPAPVRRGSIVLIDDARLYTGEGDWPTVKQLARVLGVPISCPPELGGDILIAYP